MAAGTTLFIVESAYGMSGSSGTLCFPVLLESVCSSKGCGNPPTTLTSSSLLTTAVYGKSKQTGSHRQAKISLFFPFCFTDFIFNSPNPAI